MKQHLIIPFCLGLGFLLVFETLFSTTPEADQQFAGKVNLALRQVGHQLLKLAGDTHSTIPPVEVTGPGEFTLKLEKQFNYDTLPQLLNQALLSYEIHRNYQVAVHNCDLNTPILGYNLAAFSKGKVPSIGISFFWQKNKSNPDHPSTSSKSLISLGNFTFNVQNQTLQLADDQQTLTFRESKLLHFMARHPNEVLSRDTLIVWRWEKVNRCYFMGKTKKRLT